MVIDYAYELEKLIKFVNLSENAEVHKMYGNFHYLLARATDEIEQLKLKIEGLKNEKSSNNTGTG